MNNQKSLMDMDDLMEMIANDHTANYTKELADPRSVMEIHNLNNRIVKIYDVNESCLQDVEDWLLFWSHQDDLDNVPKNKRKHPKILLYSYGGDLRVTLSLIDTIKNCDEIVETYNMGNCFSAGFFIFIAGTKGYRYTLPNSAFLVHQGSSSGGQGSFAEIQESTAFYKKEIATLKDHVLACTNIVPATLTKKWRTDWWLQAQEAIDLGIADHIVTNVADIYKN